MEDQTLTHSVWLRTRPLDSECWTSHCIAYFYLSPSDLLSLHYLFHSISPSPYPIFTRRRIPEGSKVLPVDPYLLGYSSSHIPREQVKVVCYSEKGERRNDWLSSMARGNWILWCWPKDADRGDGLSTGVRCTHFPNYTTHSKFPPDERRKALSQRSETCSQQTRCCQQRKVEQ